MTAIITSEFRFTLADTFRDSIENNPADTNYYLFVGRPEPWGPNLPDDDLVPDTPVDSYEAKLRIWDSMMGLKKILPNSTSFVIPRFDWDSTQNTIYVPYDDSDPDLFFHPTPEEIDAANLDGTYTAGSFYVMNQFYQVFKCLSNNNGAKSQIEPVAVETNPLPVIETADGYRWKYMYTIRTGDAVKFLTDHWMPVKTLVADDASSQWVVQQGAQPGVIEAINIIDPGFGYIRVRQNEEFVQGVPATNQLTIDASADSTPNYYVGATVWIEAGTGAGQSRVITAYDGTSKTLTLDEVWTTLPVAGSSTYRILPTCTITGNGTGARAKALVDLSSPNLITGVTMADVGSGYTYAVATISGAGGQDAEVGVALSPRGGHGSDAARELGGRFVMINQRLQFEEGDGDFPISNDYRQLGLVRNPLNYGTTTLSTAQTRIASQRIRVQAPSGTFDTDELISASSGTVNGFLIEVQDDPDVGNPGGKILVFTQNPETGYGDFMSLTTGDAITGQSSTAVAQVVEYLAPEIERYEGDIIYYENRRPVLRAEDQLEDIKIIIEF